LEKKKTKMDKNGQKWTEFADQQITYGKGGVNEKKNGKKMGSQMIACEMGEKWGKNGFTDGRILEKRVEKMDRR
jgi:hypothetical protein